jgi:N-alpha-acetyltransferase 35, NatC auxiliary subunit
VRTVTVETPVVLMNGEPAYSYPLSSWIYHEKLRQLELLIQLGFEQSIYSVEEYPGMYWYLSHLCSIHLSHIDRIRMFVVAARKRTPSPSSARDSGSRRKQAFEQTIEVLEYHLSTLLATEAFALALHALYTLLLRRNLIRSASAASPYSNDRLRYELRTKPFIAITLPEPVPYEAFAHEASLASDNDAAVLERATAAVAEARKAWEAILARGPFLPSPDVGNKHAPGAAAAGAGTTTAIVDDWRQDVKNTLRSCIATSIAIGSIRKAFEAQTNIGVSGQPASATSSVRMGDQGTPTLPLKTKIPDVGSAARWHDWWVVPRLTENKP